MKIFSFWVLPVISGVVWLGMLLSMLLYWIIHTDRQRYSSMADRQSIAYISDVGASTLKPLFIAGCAVTVVFLDLSFLADLWLRHRGRLVPNMSTGEKVLKALTIVFALVGTVGLICLAIFDTARHPSLHRVFLGLFIVGYLLSAVFICWEYQRLGIKYREHRVLRISFWVKLAFILVEAAIAIAFAVTMRSGNPDVAAVLEWVVAFVFSFYVFSFAIDLWPAVRTKQHARRFQKPGGSGSTSPRADDDNLEMADAPVVEGQQYPRYMAQGPSSNF
ncbi:hypothetical protein D7B24_001021 [Verticillium nonalfalfae]|uniref:CWH43-like N-terminal domain-containing protein n=1 Tax=Verticillium nonalfalfae TaxID=1051616 RepID=A0A3M9Y284_9PEZI|nr:uncharacterized protein D7B24_001021 [Verticillium nonalfalfae]RNJ53996.1 hypothetical protein D7B24_001021 [Verticillium nonalfalfae]